MNLQVPLHHTWEFNINHMFIWVSNSIEEYWGWENFLYMKRSAAVCKWDRDFSSFGSEESSSFPSANSMFPKWRIAATIRKIASWKAYHEAKYGWGIALQVFFPFTTTSDIYLFTGTDSHDIHCPSSFQVFFCIIYPIKLIAVRLIKIMVRPWIFQFVFLNILESDISNE